MCPFGGGVGTTFNFTAMEIVGTGLSMGQNVLKVSQAAVGRVGMRVQQLWSCFLSALPRPHLPASACLEKEGNRLTFLRRLLPGLPKTVQERPLIQCLGVINPSLVQQKLIISTVAFLGYAGLCRSRTALRFPLLICHLGAVPIVGFT